MAISFQKTAAQAQARYALPEKGPYFAKITNAEYGIPATPDKTPYLNITYEIYNSKKEKKGIIFDRLYISDAAFTQYRLSRFMTVLGLDGKEFGSYDDICKVVKERKLGFFITPDVSDYAKENPDKARMIVDTKAEGIFYTTAEIAEHMPEFSKPAEPAKPAESVEPASNDSAPFDVDADF